MATTSVEIVVPDGCSAGMDFTVEWGGTSYNITVPDGVTAGQLLTIELPALQEETHPTGGMQPVEIVVPDGCTPGMEFTVEWGGVSYTIAVPEGVWPGQPLTIELPELPAEPAPSILEAHTPRAPPQPQLDKGTASRTPRPGSPTVGAELATRVANKLVLGSGKNKGMIYHHRDDCGIGLVAVSDDCPSYLNYQSFGGKYVMGDCYDGYLISASQSWSTTDEFVTWLAAQSDFTLGNPGSQRITLERLTAFVNGKKGPFGY